jgi:hypothetical protein
VHMIGWQCPKPVHPPASPSLPIRLLPGNTHEQSKVGARTPQPPPPPLASLSLSLIRERARPRVRHSCGRPPTHSSLRVTAANVHSSVRGADTWRRQEGPGGPAGSEPALHAGHIRGGGQARYETAEGWSHTGRKRFLPEKEKGVGWRRRAKASERNPPVAGQRCPSRQTLKPRGHQGVLCKLQRVRRRRHQQPLLACRVAHRWGREGHKRSGGTASEAKQLADQAAAHGATPTLGVRQWQCGARCATAAHGLGAYEGVDGGGGEEGAHLPLQAPQAKGGGSRGRRRPTLP